MTSASQSLVAELDSTLRKASSSKHRTILCSVTDLFLRGAQSYSQDLITVFGDVIDRLLENIERPALIELSAKLAPINNAPVKVIGHLSCNDDIAVSGPILSKSDALTDKILFEVAKTKGQLHLAAIVGRPRISETITDILVDRGNSDIARMVVANQGARLSELGFVKLIKRAESDGELATAIANRKDIPDELRPFLKRLIATEAVVST